MAIHDVDKSNTDRNSPMPNAHDVHEGIRPAHGTISTNYVNNSSSTPNPAILMGILRLVDSNTATIPTPGGAAGSYSVTVDLGGISNPVILAFVSVTGNLIMPVPQILIDSSGGANDGKVLESYSWYTIGPSLHFLHVVSAAGIAGGSYSNAPIPVKYYIFQQASS